MDSGNYRLRRCQICQGTGFVRVDGEHDHKSTTKMKPSEVAAILAEDESEATPPPRTPRSSFGPEPPTMPDDGWTHRHLMQSRSRLLRPVRWLLVALAIFAAFALGHRR
jgi:hypothetical protein